jgi:hypothetical protein
MYAILDETALKEGSVAKWSASRGTRGVFGAIGGEESVDRAVPAPYTM